MAQMLQKPVFALPGCQRMSVNTLLCDTLGLADFEQFCSTQVCGEGGQSSLAGGASQGSLHGVESLKMDEP